MNIEEIDILQLIPQRRPFVMVDKLIYHDDTITRSMLEITDNNVLVEDGKLSEAGIVENIAQTCAARVGYIGTVINKEEVRLGFIGAIKKLNIHTLPKINQEITTEIEIMSEVFNITLVRAQSSCEGEIIATGEMKISLQ